MSIKTILVISMIIVAVNADIVFLNEDAKKACPKFSCKSANAKATETCVKGKGKLTESRTVDVSPCFKDETLTLTLNVLQLLLLHQLNILLYQEKPVLPIRSNAKQFLISILLVLKYQILTEHVLIASV